MNQNNFNQHNYQENYEQDDIENAQKVLLEEVKYGYRCTWNIWGTQKGDSVIIPNACHYTPFKSCKVINRDPIVCGKCHAILCVNSTIDHHSMSWTCTFCGGRNQFPKYLLEDQEFLSTGIVAEIDQENISVEYLTPRTTPFNPVFVFLVDRCTYDSNTHESMIRGIKEVFENIPMNSLVMFIEYGTNVEVYTFSERKIRTIYQYSGEVNYSRQHIKNINDMKDILVSKEEKYNEIMALIERFEKDPFPVSSGFRPLRCIGSAISLAISFLEGAFADSPVRHLLFTQGPCTEGPGQTSSQEISLNEKINLYAAKQFYDKQAQRLSMLGHSIDLIADSATDIGVSQMRMLFSLNGGMIILAQDFEEEIKLKSIKHLLEKDDNGVLQAGFNVKINVKTSPNLSLNKIIGEGKSVGNYTTVGSILPMHNYSIVFDANDVSIPNTYGHVQIITTYHKSDRTIVTKVTSFSRLLTNDVNYQMSSFDWQASAILQARLLISKNFEQVLDLETSIDKHLIKFTRKYANYTKNNPDSVTFTPSFSEYVKFVFFLRRSVVVQSEGISFDEFAYFKYLLYKLSIEDALKLIKPMLVQFHYQGSVNEVPLDLSSLNSQSMLVLDSFHDILLWYGQDVQEWIKQNLQDKPEFSFFKESLESAKVYAGTLKEERLPTPQYNETAAGKSKERVLLTYVNPGGSNAIRTQRIDYEKFFKTLAKHVTSSD